VRTLINAGDLEKIGYGNGLDAFGIAKAEQFTSTLEILEKRKAQGLHAGMDFTYRNPLRSTTPTVTMPDAQSLIVGARTYWKPKAHTPEPNDPQGKVALYAQENYYEKLKEGLSAVARELENHGFRAKILVDDNALVDREAAFRAGLGWYGKNANILIPKRGSWFVLGSILTNAPLEPDTPVEEGCGSCTKCITACPTQAIISPGVIDSNRCLAWLVQSAEDFPPDFREALGDRIYGCDDCQEICPINKFEERIEGKKSMGERSTVSIFEILEQDDQALLLRYGQWYIPKRDPRYLRRNALLVLGNIGVAQDKRVQKIVMQYLKSPDSMLRSYAVWTAKRLGLNAFLKGMESDSSKDVQRELSLQVKQNEKANV
jgi:epoxyqueuosine reductase